MMRTQIQIPRLLKKDVTAYYAQMRPYREGGNRIDKEQIQGKCIIHNYGHGGAGVSLAPGSAIQAVKLAASTLLNTSQDIAIIGSGVIGLMTALMVINEYPTAKVTIYAQRIPIFGEKDNNKLITSEIAPGFWLPYAYGSNSETEHNYLSALSYKYYLNLSHLEQYSQWIKEVEVFDIADQEYKYDYFNVLTKQIRPTFKEFKLKINQKLTVDCRYFKTIKIDMQPFLGILINKLKQKGVNFVQKKIMFQDLKKLSEKIIFNCAALGSRELFDQKLMKGVKGHLIEYRNTNPSQYNYLLKANIGKQFLTYYMHSSRIIMGITRESEQNSVVNMDTVSMLQATHEKLLAKLGLFSVSPKL